MPPHLLPIAVEDECWYLHNVLQAVSLSGDSGAVPMLNKPLNATGQQGCSRTICQTMHLGRDSSSSCRCCQKHLQLICKRWTLCMRLCSSLAGKHLVVA